MIFRIGIQPIWVHLSQKRNQEHKYPSLNTLLPSHLPVLLTGQIQLKSRVKEIMLRLSIQPPGEEKRIEGFRKTEMDLESQTKYIQHTAYSLIPSDTLSAPLYYICVIATNTSLWPGKSPDELVGKLAGECPYSIHSNK